MPRYAVIDVGTNSVKFHVGEHDAKGKWTTVVDRAEVTRLGEGLAATGGDFSPEAMERTAAAIAGMAAEAKQRGVTTIAAVGTMGLRTARNRVRAAARKVGLPENLTLAACRHGGLTELGDAELTEQGVMALSGHRTPEAARLYVKRTETQRAAGARKRRAWVEASRREQDEDKSQNSAPARESENGAK